ncbi:MAG: amino acid permease [Rickettsiaceae bacterium]|nr:amino acid permease [Rickettsiaceae bacterium]
MNFFRKKTFESVKEGGANSGLAKTLNGFDLIMLGLGAIIGSGVFVLTGIVAAKYSGPAVMLSYVIAGITCVFVALAYTELAAMLPTSGSIYTYAYVAFGEIVAWAMVGVLVLELTVSASGVAAAWSGYVTGLLKAGGVNIPEIYTSVPAHGGIVNIPAILIVMFVTFVLYLGTKDSKKLNTILVLIKMTAIGIFVIVAVPHFDVHNWDNFMPYGFDDVLKGASILFFAFTGFGSLATAAEECQNPKRDIMIGIIGSLTLSAVIYVTVGGLATGITSFENLDNAQPLAHALTLNNSHIGSAIVAIGAVCGLTTVVMVNIYAQSRIFYAMSRDGLLPRPFARLHPKYDSPYISIMLVSVVVSILAGLCPLELIAQMSSMGALVDYMVVLIIVMIFRVTMPKVARSFKCPALFVIAPTGIVACLYLLLKQMIDKDGSLITAGKVLLMWLVCFVFAYIIRELFFKRSKI